MKKLDSALLCLEIDSIALGYRVLARLSDDAEMRIIEASPAGARFIILLLGGHETLLRAQNEARSALEGVDAARIVDSVLLRFLQASDRAVVEALYSLQTQMLDDCLVIVESASVSGCLAASNELVSVHGLKPIEIRVHRSGTGGAHGFLTGSVKSARGGLEGARLHLRLSSRAGRIEIVEPLTKSFKSFFEPG